jgi:hypothetical protein
MPLGGLDRDSSAEAEPRSRGLPTPAAVDSEEYDTVMKMEVDETGSVCPSDNDEVEIIPPQNPKFEIKREVIGNGMMVQRMVFTGTGKVGAILPSAKKIEKREKKKKVRRVHYIPVLSRPGEEDKMQDFACHVRDEYIWFSRSDSKEPPDRESFPTLDPPEVVKDGHVNYYYRLPSDSSQVFWWKAKIGTWLARYVLKLDDAVQGKRKYALQEFPANYVLFQHRNGPKHDPRTDCYLESSGKVFRFRSPEEFFPHAEWLIKKKGPDGLRDFCCCKYCRARRRSARKKAGIQHDPDS